MATGDLFKAKARELARSGDFYGLRPLVFELRFEKGFHETRAWLELTSTKEELEGLCREFESEPQSRLTRCYSSFTHRSRRLYKSH